jgi:glucokinase
MTDLFLGIDLGGTNVKLGLCTASGEVRGSASLPTQAERGPADTVARVAAAARALMEGHGKARACASGVPGTLDLGRRLMLRPVNFRGWSNVPYPAMLGEALGLPTWMENDANCAAWGEYVAGAGRGADSLALYTLGTGIGGGIVLRGDLWLGASGAAGEFGHMTVHPGGLPCPCGLRGCLEQYASAGALARRWGKGDARECFEAARRGDADATAAVDETAEALSLGIASTLHVLHPELIVLAGGMALAGDLLLDRVRRGVRANVFETYLERIRIELTRIPGDDAGWLGAALWGARKAGSPSSIREPTRLRSPVESDR